MLAKPSERRGRDPRRFVRLTAGPVPGPHDRQQLAGRAQLPAERPADEPAQHRRRVRRGGPGGPAAQTVALDRGQAPPFPPHAARPDARHRRLPCRSPVRRRRAHRRPQVRQEPGAARAPAALRLPHVPARQRLPRRRSRLRLPDEERGAGRVQRDADRDSASVAAAACLGHCRRDRRDLLGPGAEVERGPRGVAALLLVDVDGARLHRGASTRPRHARRSCTLRRELVLLGLGARCRRAWRRTAAP